jgi:hypothetical protein
MKNVAFPRKETTAKKVKMLESAETGQSKKLRK